MNMELGNIPYTNVPLEVAGHYVRTMRTDKDLTGLIVAEFPHGYSPKYMGDANLFVAAQDLLNVAYMVLDTATDHTPADLISAATNAIDKAMLGEMR